MKLKVRVFGLLAAVLLSGGASAGSLQEQGRAKSLLEAMCDAMGQRSYHGTFVHVHNNKIESMEIVRRKDPRGELEKIRSLNGEAREIIRDQDVVTCILPKSRKVTIDKSRPGSQLPLALPQNLDNVEAFYSLSIDGQERIAGLQSTIVSLVPKDSYRYGHRVWIDDGSKLMVKSDLLDQQGVPIEQLMFTQLSVDASLPDEMFLPTLQSTGFQRVEVGKEKIPEAMSISMEWQLSQAPHGFTLVTHTRKMAKNKQLPVEHMVLSDGMASVSVFIEPVQKKTKYLIGGSSMGAVNAYGSIKRSHKVVVVGEVPAATVKLINQYVERVAQ